MEQYTWYTQYDDRSSSNIYFKANSSKCQLQVDNIIFYKDEEGPYLD